ncbi:MAG: hypothetical protein ACE5MG_13340 [Candidatus Methylomirabilales bacterium]
MSERPEAPDQADISANRVTVVDRDKYDALVTERDFLLSAFLRRRIVAIIAAFLFATTTALAGFWGGFAVGHQTNQESFKVLCSQVVDEAMKRLAPQKKTVRNEHESADRAASVNR